MPAGSYAFVLDPIDEQHTRLIVRDRAVWRAREWPFAALVYEPLHAYMETGLMRGLKACDRAAPIPLLEPHASERRKARHSMASRRQASGGRSPWSSTP